MSGCIQVIDHDGRVLEVEAGQGLTLAQAVFLDPRLDSRPLCAGLGRCGQCRVRFATDAPAPVADESRVLGNEALDQGWRLACRHPAVPGSRIELPAPRSRPARSEAKKAAGPLSLAVDLGTTSLHWAALSAGLRIATGSELNPQMGAGAEVMSRLAFAADPARAARLRELVLDRLRRVVAALPGPVEECCVAGNPAMVYLLLGLDLAGLSAAPYGLDFAGHAVVDLAPDLPRAYVPPLMGPFVGADATAGLAHLLAAENPPALPLLLADLGTNGEFVLALSETDLLAASVPMGPALEGVGLSCGSLAQDGAATAFTLAPGGLRASVLGGAALPASITGTGYLSLLRCLLAAKVLDRTGRFASPDAPGLTPLARSLLAGIGGNGERSLALPGGLRLAGEDVEEALKVKAAFNVALWRLLDSAGLRTRDLASVRLAGALGEHADLSDLEALGFLPPGLAERTSAVGNSSLAGAMDFLIRPGLRDRAADLARAARVLDLAGEPGFDRLYIDRMVFDYVD